MGREIRVSHYWKIVAAAVERGLGDLVVDVLEDDLAPAARRVIGGHRVEFRRDPVSETKWMVRIERPDKRPPLYFRLSLAHAVEHEWRTTVERIEERRA